MFLSFTVFFFFSSRRRHTRFKCDWSSDVCSSDLKMLTEERKHGLHHLWMNRGCCIVVHVYAFHLCLLDFTFFYNLNPAIEPQSTRRKPFNTKIKTLFYIFSLCTQRVTFKSPIIFKIKRTRTQ